MRFCPRSNSAIAGESSTFETYVIAELEMKRFTVLAFFLFSVAAFAQNISVHSMDSVAYVNSHTGSLAEAHIALINTSATTQSYIIKRSQVGSTGLVDSNYFCWDLCYPTWVNQSQGYVDINAGAVAYDFSGYAYVMDTAANGQDTIWYTFENINDSTDFLTVQVIYAFSTTFGQGEPVSYTTKIYPNPSNTGRVTMEFAPAPQASTVEVLDVLGKVHAQMNVPAFATKAVWNSQDAAKGVYLLRKRSGHQLENLGKVLVH